MKIHSDIAALRSDPVSQRRIAGRMRKAKQVWQDDTWTARILEDLRAYGAGCSIENCPELTAITNDHALATDFAEFWMNGFASALRDEPLGEVPFLYRSAAGFSSMRIAAAGRAAINLVVYERCQDEARGSAMSALFVDSESHEMVLTGTASATFHAVSDGNGGRPTIRTKELKLSPGDQLSLNGLQESRQINSVDGSMVMLQVSRVPDKPAPSLEYRLSDCALIKTVSGDKSASQRFVALGVLRELGGGSARSLEAMQNTALNKNEDIEVRWEAVRHCLAADTKRGWALLDRLIVDADDDLTQPALRLREQLVAHEPILAQLSKDAA
ncbi:hypothetical protein [Erythrobacter crassostreae]|uniref:Uncharacterized protein n=1 Tax=Erythrobacter crassostreae TaxID=2828328 RepID=A0A9X1F3A7_9SPHN|nr:hypothetical protein [Erythrobacter crassostrea]MBV7259531.1 hypothetical protein [Erythrobacter crassostrea]